MIKHNLIWNYAEHEWILSVFDELDPESAVQLRFTDVVHSLRHGYLVCYMHERIIGSFGFEEKDIDILCDND